MVSSDLAGANISSSISNEAKIAYGKLLRDV